MTGLAGTFGIAVQNFTAYPQMPDVKALVEYGINVARRAWLEKDDVFNTQTAAQGIGAGLLMAAGLAQVFSGTIPIIPKFSVVPYVGGTAVVVMATAAAALIPSLRTTRIDPSRALRVD